MRDFIPKSPKREQRPYDPIPFPNVDGFSRAGEEDQDDTSGSAALTRE